MQPGLARNVTAAAVAAAVTASATGITVSLWVAAQDRQPMPSAGLSAAVVGAFAVTGAVVASARPGNRVGWVMLVGALLWALGNAGVDVAHRGLVVAPGSVAGASAWAIAGSALRGVGWWTVVAGVPVLFPDGRVAGPRWRWLLWTLSVLAGGCVLGVVSAADANVTGLGAWRNPVALPTALQPISGMLSLGSLFAGVVVTAGAAGQLWARWRCAGLGERQQLTLLAVAACLPIAVGPIVLAGGAGGWLFSAAALPLPLAIGFAVLARGLYDLRTAVNRTLVWVTLSAVVAGFYALIMVGVGSRFNVRGTVWLPWVAAAVIAVTFAPLRDGLQRAVNRLTYGRWDEPYDVLAALGKRLEAATDVDGLLAEAMTELRSLGIRQPAVCDTHGHVLAGHREVPADVTEITLSAFGNRVGALRYRPPEMNLRARDGRLLHDLAGYLGGVLHAHRLTLDLQRALEQVVLGREEERRRLRRDLHDGLGPALAGHLLRLDVIAGKLGGESAVAADVGELREDLRATVLEVRRVVEGLRPPALDELGLSGALAQFAQRLTVGTPVTVELRVAETAAPLPAAMEVAAFRIVTEALTNAVRHAQAASCRVDIEGANGVLRIAIHDDGRGIGPAPVPAAGHGLHTMRERAEELRGRLRVTTGDGTTVVAELPLPTHAGPVADPIRMEHR